MNENNNNKIEENQAGKEHGVFHLGYDAKDDIYNKVKNEVAIEPENILLQKFKNQNNQAELDDNDLGNGLDVHDAYLDDQQENIGAEDEENSYYSLGLDNHNNLYENRED